MIKKLLMLITICTSVLLVGCVGEPSETQIKMRAEELEAYAIDQFFLNDYEEYVRKLRNASGLSDLDFDMKMHYYPEFQYDVETKTLDAECELLFKSDEIDNYYTTEYNKASSVKLAKVLNDLKNAYYKGATDTYTYTSQAGTVKFKINNWVNDEICIKTSSGREYVLNYVVDIDVVEIDGEWIYKEDVKEDTSTTDLKDSYTGTYDATLKYSGTSGVLICISEDAMDRFMSAVSNGNEGTIDELFDEGQVAYTEQGTKCNIVDKKTTKCKVKLLDGAYAGNTVWVVREAIQEK